MKGGAYWYTGAFEPAFYADQPRFVVVNDVYAPLAYDRPVIDVAIAPPTFHAEFLVGGGPGLALRARAGATIPDGVDRALGGAGRDRALDGAAPDRALDGAVPNGARWSCASATRSSAIASGSAGTTAAGTAVRLQDTSPAARTAAGAEGRRDTNRGGHMVAGTQAPVRRRTADLPRTAAVGMAAARARTPVAAVHTLAAAAETSFTVKDQTRRST